MYMACTHDYQLETVGGVYLTGAYVCHKCSFRRGMSQEQFHQHADYPGHYQAAPEELPSRQNQKEHNEFPTEVGEEANRQRTRLIIADDHKLLLDTVAALLAPEFDIVGTAHDGKALLETAGRLDPDVVVLDISMPIFDGLEVARRLKKRGARAKVVFLTAHDDEDFVREALSTGAAGYVVKRSMVGDLTHAIREALAGRIFISSSLEQRVCAGKRDKTSSLLSKPV